MKKILFFILILNLGYSEDYLATEGDIFFQTSASAQSKAIQLATKSPYSHVGILVSNGKTLQVLEAVQPVKFTPIKHWLNRGVGGHYIIKRPIKALTQEQLQKLRQDSRKYLGKPYDLTFEWSNDRIYCSELVWKLYQSSVGIELAPLAKLKEFDLSSSIVKAKMKERYGNKIPFDEPVIAPAAIFDSPYLETVAEK